MQDEYIKELLEKYKACTITDTEKAVLDKWYLHVAADQSNELSEAERLKTFDDVLGHLNEVIYPRRTAKLWPRIAAAASIVLAVGLGTLFYVNRHNEHNKPELSAKNDIAPGKQGATLTLANGQKIRLTQAANGKLAQQSGVTITKTQNGQLVYQIEQQDATNTVNTLSTAKGETYQVRLPDGSAVWLNSASSLTYNASLMQNGKRTVKLTGEGYFEVAKDKAHPFIVQTADQEVEVLGTHFDINSYADEPAVATTLLEGSVKVSAGSQQRVIKPGEQALNNSKNLRVAEVNTDNVTDWKDGDFNLNDVPFKVAMRKIARWYDVELVYDNEIPDNLNTVGWVSRNRQLSVVLKAIESVGTVKFRIEGQKLHIQKNLPN